MNTVRTRAGIAGLLFIMLTLAACGNVSATAVTAGPASTEAWQTYTSTKYQFSIQYPADWQVRASSVLDNLTPQDQIWFAAEVFPPPDTDAQPDLTLILTQDDPSARWAQEHFDEYESEIIRVGKGTATRISGVNRESLNRETAVILKLRSGYLQMLPGQSEQALGYFDRIVASFDSAVALPAGTPAVESAPCVAPYFDPVAVPLDHDRILLRSDSGVMIFNLETGKEELALEPSMPVVKAALSPDGNILAWALADHSIELIELPGGKNLHTLTGHTDMVTAIKFSANGDRLYTASHDNSVRVWDMDGGLVSEMYPGGGEVLGLGVSPDDTKLAVVTFEGPQKLWDIKSNELIREIGSSGAFDGADAGFSADGQLVGIGLGGGPTSLWDSDTGTQLWSGGNYALALSPDGNLMAYSDEESGENVVVLRPLAEQGSLNTLKVQGAPVWKVLFSADSSRLVSADGNEIRIWQARDGKLLYRLMSACP